MTEIFPFFIVLLAGLVFSGIFKRFNVPWTVALIIGGIIIGPFGFEIISPDTTLEFLKYLGLVFLMFMAGIETRLSGFRQVWKESTFIGTVTGLFPFLAGAGIGFLLGYDIQVIILLGIIFTSSSIAIAVPTLESKGLLHSKLGKTIVSAIVIQDIASLIILALFLQYIIPGTLPFPVFITLFFFVLFILAAIKWGIPRLQWIFDNQKKFLNPFERDIRIAFVVLMGTVIIFEFLGLHAIIGAFLAGLILSEVIKEKSLKEKIHVMAYGLFIPVFFIMVGIDTNIKIFLETQNILLLVFGVILASILSKFISGWISARMAGFSFNQSSLVGGACVPQLSTTLAVIAVGQQHNLIPEELVATLIILSIITVFISPLVVGKTAQKVKDEYFVTSTEDNKK